VEALERVCVGDNFIDAAGKKVERLNAAEEIAALRPLYDRFIVKASAETVNVIG
jgi:hypothetical protein